MASISKVKKRRKGTKRDELPALDPKHRRIADMYNAFMSKNEIAYKMSMKWMSVDKILKSEDVKKYLDIKQSAWDEIAKDFHDALIEEVGKQIIKGKKEVRRVYNRKGELTSTITTHIPFSMREMMDMAKLSGRYNPSLTVNKIDIKKDEDKNYEEILEHLESLQKMEEKNE